MAQTMTAPKIKALIKSSGGQLYVNTVEDQSYASDKYWLAPVERVRPLLDHFNLSGECGTYDVGATVTDQSDSPAPNIEHLVIDHHASTKVAARPVMLAGRPAMVRTSRDLVVVVETPEGETPAGINVAMLVFLAGEQWAEDLASGSLVLTMNPSNCARKTIGVYRTTETTAYHHTGGRKVYRTVEPVALVMPVRL